MSEFLGDRRIRRATRRGRDTATTPLCERLALTTEQVEEHNLPVISKPDRRGGRVQYFDAVETEAFGQANIVATVQARIDELMPEPLDDVLEREQTQRAEVIEQLQRLRD